MFYTNSSFETRKRDAGVLENMKHSHVYMRFPEGRAKALTFSFDDGVIQDEWLVETLHANKMKGTFNINSGLCMYDEVDYDKLNPLYFPIKDIQKRLTRDKFIQLFCGSEMEVACHGYTHAQLDLLDTASILRELIFDRTELERVVKKNVRGFAYPQGSTNDIVISCMRQCGLLYGRLAGASFSLAVPSDPYRIMPSCHYLQDEAYDFAKKFIQKEITSGVFDWNTNAALLYIWGHGYEMRTPEDYRKAENLIKLLAGREEIWYCTNIEFFEYKQAFDGLVFSAEREFVQNVSCLPVWVYANGKTIVVPAGETIAL